LLVTEDIQNSLAALCFMVFHVLFWNIPYSV
jgi:hypothetical protein